MVEENETRKLLVSLKASRSLNQLTVFTPPGLSHSTLKPISWPSIKWAPILIRTHEHSTKMTVKERNSHNKENRICWILTIAKKYALHIVIPRIAFQYRNSSSFSYILYRSEAQYDHMKNSFFFKNHKETK